MRSREVDAAWVLGAQRRDNRRTKAMDGTATLTETRVRRSERHGSLLVPGRNCWRIERAHRVSWLIDGAQYFGAVRAALAQAQSTIFIIGWDIDSRMQLVPTGARDG